MALNDLIIRQAKPKEKRYTLSDGHGLLLEIWPNGKKYWIIRAKKDKKEKRKYIGQYPEISLREAREQAIMGRKHLFDEPVQSEQSLTFGDIAAEWFAKRMSDKNETYVKKTKMRVDNHILPEIGNMPIKEITSGMILKLCRKIESNGTFYTASRIKQIIGQIFRYTIATDRAENDPTVALAGALQTQQVKHRAAITKPSEIAMLIKNINAYPRAVTRCALKFSVLVFCRPGEIQHAEWSEIDFDNRLWKIPAEKMNMKRPHIIPLSSQVVDLLTELKKFTGRQKWLFPSARLNGRCMSENTVRVALRTLGYSKSEIVPHGFRSMASTILNEQGWSPDVIERQLVHVEQNKVRAAYNRAEYLDERKNMMQSWADWLDGLE